MSIKNEPMGLVGMNANYAGKTINHISEENDRRHPMMSLVIHFTDGTTMSIQVPVWYSLTEHR